ncbi:MAGUK family [Caenorhabditis elegans]|uniref:MAGUK family n=1 Tax=Caenorhabditis elegans TaxID=6239 RepID=Q95XW5_CAEEL|nr:MAGUK family [Caenorhabditis elegans]CCD69159.1 MAGUK family [Caenorhabditis elegans]|eukprot:NP_497201.1 MAGUK family [Caenorhabditis elegans]
MPDNLSAIFGTILDYAEEVAAGTSNENDERPPRTSLTKKQQKAVSILRNFSTNDQKQEISFQELSQNVLDDWDISNIKSSSVQQLVELLNLPRVQGVLWAAQEISAGRFAPQLPDVPFEVDEDDGVAVKIVRIVRRGEPLGATIKCERGKVYVARIMANGVADRSGCIQEGDRVLEVNGITVADKEPREIVKLLDKCDNGIITFKLIPAEINQKLKQKKSSHRYARALFDYDPWQDKRHPCPEAAISFRGGDILEILDEKDQYWWQTRKIGFGALARRKESHDDENRDDSKKVGLVPSEWLQCQSEIPENGIDTSDDFQSFLENHKGRFYESVFRWRNKKKRRRVVVLLGAPGVGRNEIRRQFFKVFADRFTNAIPHTSRPQRPNESDGVNYYFTSRSEMERMIERKEMLEYGEFRDNLYGTALKSVRKASEKGTVLLTPHPLAIENIRTWEFAPIVIFVQPPEFGEFKHTREVYRSQTTRSHSAASSSNISQNTAATSAARAFSDVEIRQIIDNSAQMEQKYRGYCDAIIRNVDLDTTMNELTGLIYQLESKATWMPMKWLDDIGE